MEAFLEAVGEPGGRVPNQPFRQRSQEVSRHSKVQFLFLVHQLHLSQHPKVDSEAPAG